MTMKTLDTLADLRLLAGTPKDQVSMAGYHAPNDGGGGVFVWDAASTEADNGGTVVQPTGGTAGRWLRMGTTDEVSVKFFGAKGDGTADDTAAIQATVDFALRNQVPIVSLPAGSYKTSGPIHLGYGNTLSVFTKVHLVGADRSFMGNPQVFPGSILLADFCDAPAVVVQGGRDVQVKNLTLFGCSRGHGADWMEKIEAQQVSYADVSNPQKWVKNVPPEGMTPFAPYAGIAIDPYSGPRPEDSAYPEVTYPEWSGDPAPYNKAFSSKTTIENVWIEGFYVGIANQPSNADGNGDFTTIRDANIVGCSHGISVGNTQSRNVGVYNSSFQYVHTLFSTDAVGRQNGRMGGPIVNCSAGQIYQVFSFPNSITGPVLFDSFYVEGYVRLGVADLTGGGTNPVILNACTFGYAGYSEGKKTGLIYNVPWFEGDAPLTLNGTDVLFRGAFGLICGKYGNISLFNASVVAWGYHGVENDAEKLAYNYLLGGVGVLSDSRRLEGTARFQTFQGLPSPLPALPPVESFTDTVRGRSQVHHYVRYIQYSPDEGGPRIPVQRFETAGLISLSSGTTSPAFDADTFFLTFGYPDAQQSNYNRAKVEPGCILWHQDSNAMFVVHGVEKPESSGGDWSVTAKMVTNYEIDDQGKRRPVVPVLPEGYLYLYQTFHKTTTFQYRGDTTQGSPVLENVRRSDGYGGSVPWDFQVGDLVFHNDRFWDTPLPKNARVVEVSAGRIKLDKPVGQTAQGVPIELYR